MTESGRRSAACARCRRTTYEPVMIDAVEVGSGPGFIVYACPPCAHAYAATPFAPAWLREDLGLPERGPEL